MISGGDGVECTSERLIYRAVKQQIGSIKLKVSFIRRLNITAGISVHYSSL